MTREDIRRAFPEATEEQINGLLNIHSADIGRARGNSDQLRAELTQAQADLAAAHADLATAQAAAANADQLQRQVDAYQQAEQRRQQQEQAAQARAALLNRMEAVLKGRAFVVDDLRDVVADKFQAALDDQANVGRSDAEIFEALTRDKGYFASQNRPAVNMPPMGNLRTDGDMTREAFLKLTTAEQAKYKRENEGNFYMLFPELGTPAN